MSASSPRVLRIVPASANVKVTGFARLLRDLQEIHREPVAGVEVHVCEDDVTRLCVVLSPQAGRFEGIRLHLSVRIPENYPKDSPQVSISTPFAHPNVFGSYICCDILKGHIVREPNGYIGGYTPAYSLQTIFVQLLSFFTADRVEQEWGGTFIKAYDFDKAALQKQIARFVCKDCGFNLNASRGLNPNRTRRLPRPAEANFARLGRKDSGFQGLPSTNIAGDDQACALGILDSVPDCWSLIAENLTTRDLLILARAYPPFAKAVDTPSDCVRRELRCFYLHVGFKDEILGIGISKTGTGRQTKITSGFELLSYKAFREYRVREGPWGEEISAFLPLVLNGPHFANAQSMIEDQLMALAGRNEGRGIFDPAVVVQVLAKWMNQMVVDLMKNVGGEETKPGSTATKTVLHASEKALNGYCTLLHLLLTFARRYRTITEVAHQQVHRFLARESGRSKKEVPDFGEALCWFALVPNLSWQAVGRTLFDELLVRNVYWTLTKYPHLAYMETTTSALRLQQTFLASATGLRLFMFQSFFLKKLIWGDSNVKSNVASDAKAEEATVATASQDNDGWQVVVGSRTRAELKRQGIPAYDAFAVDEHLDSLLAVSARTYGFPSPTLSATLASEARRILKVTTWEQVHEILHLDISNESAMSRLLKAAVRKSEEKVYHMCPYDADELWKLRNAVEPRACSDIKPRDTRLVRPGRSFFPNPRTLIRRRAAAAAAAAATTAAQEDFPFYACCCYHT
ncbi:hypothetical protein HDU86_000075 [Geranomyces michiganensis]|nr:hypothetical protein HDU86_000075 [Geranomyces michiganensis]